MNDMTTPITSDSSTDPGTPDEIRALMRDILVDHAVSLDGIFGDFTNHAVQVFADSPFASQTYLRLALRAQSGCRFALESVVRSDRADAAAAAREAEASGADAVPSVAIAAPTGNGARRIRRNPTH